jgi:predicted nucleic acid-binding protein
VTVLVDTNIWSLALRRSAHQLSLEERASVSELERLIRGEGATILGPIRQEVLSGIREAPQVERVAERLRAFPDVPLREQDYEYAAEISNRLRTSGLAASPVDALIAGAAIRRNWAVFTRDSDFPRLASVLPLRIHAWS